jgi:spore maturation protein CgeB
MRQAWSAPPLRRRWSWYVLGRPPYLHRFSQEVVQTCRTIRPDVLLCAGLGAIEETALAEIGRLGVQRLIFLTDDPWSRGHKSRWLFRALPQYDVVFSPRRCNLAQLQAVGCRRVEYLPFGYDPELFFPDRLVDERVQAASDGDVLVVAGADRDRLPYVVELLRSGARVALYGNYWERYRATRRLTQGLADPATVRRATSVARVSLCLVRRSNRDGHVMRSYEIAACGGCMLAEDTEEHRAILGPEGETVLYFASMQEMIDKTHWLLQHPEDRARLAANLHRRIAVDSDNTYKGRLQQMLAAVPGTQARSASGGMEASPR